MLNRRTLCTGAGVLAVIVAMPTGHFSSDLTSDERFILDALGTHATAAQRAWTLETYREGTPMLRKAMRYVAGLAPEKVDQLLAAIEGALAPTA